jgi:hypothetical protein
MFHPLLAAGWEDLLKLAPIVIGVLVWVISHFAGQVKPKVPPQRRPIGQPPQPGAPQQAKDPLQAEIDEFLRQAQALREGRPAAQPQRPGSPQRDQPPQPARTADSQRSRPFRRPSSTPPKRGARRDETRTVSRPTPPPVVEVVETPPARQPLSARLDSDNRFAQRAAQFSRMQEESDSEFKKHMDRVFSRDVSTLKPSALGVFEAAGASAKAAHATADAAATASAAGNQSATAPSIARQHASDIALFLAGRKNIRDAIILTEILNRPEGRW